MGLDDRRATRSVFEGRVVPTESEIGKLATSPEVRKVFESRDDGTSIVAGAMTGSTFDSGGSGGSDSGGGGGGE